MDIYGFKYSESRTLLENGITSIILPTGEEKPPSIILINPKSKNLNLYAGDPFNLRFRADIGTATREIQVLIDDIVHQTATSGEIFVIPMSSAGLTE